MDFKDITYLSDLLGGSYAHQKMMQRNLGRSYDVKPQQPKLNYNAGFTNTPWYNIPISTSDQFAQEGDTVQGTGVYSTKNTFTAPAITPELLEQVLQQVMAQQSGASQPITPGLPVQAPAAKPAPKPVPAAWQNQAMPNQMKSVWSGPGMSRIGTRK